MNPLQQQIAREWQLLLTDAWLRALVSWVPLVLFFILWWIFSAGIPRDIPIGVVDLDRSDLSRNLVRQYDSHPALSVVRQYNDAAQGAVAMRSAEINALILIPSELKTKMLKGQAPPVTAFYNSQYLLTGNLVAAGLQAAHGTFGAKIGVGKALGSGKIGGQALAAAVPVGTQTTALFNINTNYAHFLVSGLLPAFWQILIVVVTILALARESRSQGLSAWLADHAVLSISGKLLPYTLILWLQGIAFLVFMFVVLRWPMNGSIDIIILSQLLMVLASQAIGLLLYLLVNDPARAMSMAAVYTAPSFAFMGVTFPATDMTVPAQMWRDMLPVSHYIDVHLFQANHGASINSALPHMGALLLFFVAFPLAYKLAIRIQQAEVAP
ncbi:MAG: ABC transporter permease [Thiohalomonadales bacterium]